jgi:2-phospho-L-lactate guanylyltransferase
MRVVAVPVKRLERSKSRLSSLLTPVERAVLTLAMLEDVLDAALDQPGWEVWLVSKDEAALEVGARRGARPVVEAGSSLLAAVRQVEAEVPGMTSSLAVLLADLPLITASVLGEALAADLPVTAAPAASDGGTNLLLRRPASVIPARFGRDSFARHRWAARRARVAFEAARHPDLAFDLDRPEDVERLLAVGAPGRTGLACHELGLPDRLRRPMHA